MDVSYPLTAAAGRVRADASTVTIPQYSRRAILAIWAAAALPMGALAWLVAPVVSHHLSGQGNLPLVKALLALLTAGLVLQFVLVAALVWREQRSLRWSTVRDALWLNKPRSPRSGRSGGKLWLLLIPLILLEGAEQLLPEPGSVSSHSFGRFLDSHAAQTFFHGNWSWFAVVVVLGVFNTVLGEELLFRGFLLRRMNGAFRRGDWLVNGVLFAAYHLHEPWVFLSPLADSFVIAYPTKRYRSAWIGIGVHSIQTVAITAIVLGMVL